MKNVLVTGSSGFIGRNLLAELGLNNDITVQTFDRKNTIDELDQKVAECDFVFHVAGVNRPDNDDEFTSGNVTLTKKVLLAIEKTKKVIPIIITSSVQSTLDNPYGISKKAAEDFAVEWHKKTQNPVYLFRLPNVFGKWSKPNYNSVVATFCHNYAHDQEVTISDPEKEITFVYINDVINAFTRLLEDTTSSEIYPTIQNTRTISLGDLAKKISSFKLIPETLTVPDFAEPFDRYLYATYTSYLPKEKFSYKLKTNSDQRGWLAEFIKSENFGQIFVSSTEPGFTRGNHWHHTKIEKFLVVAGKGDIKLRQYGTNEILTFSVSSEEPTVVDMPAGYIHSITNVGDTPMIAVFWSDEILNIKNPDTHFEEV